MQIKFKTSHQTIEASMKSLFQIYIISTLFQVKAIIKISR